MTYIISRYRGCATGRSFAGAKKDLRKRPERRSASDYPAGPVDQLTAIGELGCIREDALEEYIHTASRIGGGCIAYLLDYKHRIGKIRDMIFL